MIDDVKIALQFLTRLPIGLRGEHGMADLARAAWAFPLVGCVVGGFGALAYFLAHLAGLPPSLGAILAVGAMIVTTGALHEDGLADTIDALGGRADRERALAIMRDSRIGTYGTLALIVGLALRTAAIAAIADPGAVALALVGTAAVSRALMAVTMAAQAPARADGLGAAVGGVTPAGAVTACLLATAILLPARSVSSTACILATAAAAFVAMHRWTSRRLGGFTGDTVGAVQQLGEMACLVVFAAIWA